jgi:hypothetical protein
MLRGALLNLGGVTGSDARQFRGYSSSMLIIL